MNEMTNLINLSMSSSGLILALAGFFMALVSRILDTWKRTFFKVFFAVMILYMASSLLSTVATEYMADPGLSKLAVFLESLLSSMLMPMLTEYLLRCCGESWQKNKLFGVVVSLWVLYLLLLGLTQFTTGIYYITPDNVYHRGPWYPVLLAPPVAIMACNCIGLIRRRGQVSRRLFCGFLFFFLVPMAAMLLQMMFYGILSIVFGTAVAAFALFVVILTEQTEQFVRVQEENARQRVDLMVLQMRPHFIYNTMTSAYYLCQQDPGKAQRVILDFTSYLRKSFTAVASSRAIPFTEELEHTRAYLAVEQVRFEDELFVTWDTPYTAFRLPPLTLQPVVENAVKHGLDPEQEALRITVHTRERDGGSEIVVEDTGKGYRPEEDGEPHIALKNIRERLALMCKGTLTIAPRPEGGTAVTIFIPAESNGADAEK